MCQQIRHPCQWSITMASEESNQPDEEDEAVSSSTTPAGAGLSQHNESAASDISNAQARGTIALSGPANGTSSFDFRDGKLTVKHMQTSGSTQPGFNRRHAWLARSPGLGRRWMTRT
jgi:hypothetical protein